MASTLDGMKWFKATFGADVSNAVANTPFTLNFLTVIATQETSEVWLSIFQTLSTAEVLAVCVGDTIDGPNRTAFPTGKAALLAIPNGEDIFETACAALVAVGRYDKAYGKIAANNPNKFCHGFGIFQYDIQFCRNDPDFFLQKQWYDFDACLAKCLQELKVAQAAAKLLDKPELSDLELAYVAIAYNTGSFNPAKGLKQGFKDADGRYYGELIAGYIQLAAQA